MSHVEAMLVERAALLERGKTARAAHVEAELARLGYHIAAEPVIEDASLDRTDVEQATIGRGRPRK